MGNRTTRTFASVGTLVLLAGCGGVEAPSDSTAAQVATSVGAAAIGMEVSTSDLPAFVVLPDDAKALQRMNANDAGKKGGMIVVETGKAPAEILAFYRDVMAKNGMTVAMETTTADGAMIAGATQGEAQAMNVIITGGTEGRTSVAITHAEKQG
jgi:hypothetical protein